MIRHLASSPGPGLLFLLLSQNGRVLAAPQRPMLNGEEPWQWCWKQQDRDRCLLAFAEACMRRNRVEDINLSLRMGERCEEYSADLMPVEGGNVVCLMRPRHNADLTKAEREVLQLVAQGRSNAEIGKQLKMAQSTVRTHLASIRQRLGVERVEQLVAAAMGYSVNG